MISASPVPPKEAVSKTSKTHCGSNVRTTRYTSHNGCLVEDVVLADGRELSAVAYTQERLDRMMERAR